jgi:hypothetical protein
MRIAANHRMSCPWLRGGKLCRCQAVRGGVVPSLYERERFCHGERSRCPTYQRLRARGGPIEPAEYYGLWLAPERP